jgi:hypothetical protein
VKFSVKFTHAVRVDVQCFACNPEAPFELSRRGVE